MGIMTTLLSARDAQRMPRAPLSLPAAIAARACCWCNCCWCKRGSDTRWPNTRNSRTVTRSTWSCWKAKPRARRQSLRSVSRTTKLVVRHCSVRCFFFLADLHKPKVIYSCFNAPRRAHPPPPPANPRPGFKLTSSGTACRLRNMSAQYVRLLLQGARAGRSACARAKELARPTLFIHLSTATNPAYSIHLHGLQTVSPSVPPLNSFRNGSWRDGSRRR